MSKFATKPTNQADFKQNLLMVCRFCGKFAHGWSMFGSLGLSLFECDVITFLTWRGGGAAQNASVGRTRQSRPNLTIGQRADQSRPVYIHLAKCATSSQKSHGEALELLRSQTPWKVAKKRPLSIVFKRSAAIAGPVGDPFKQKGRSLK